MRSHVCRLREQVNCFLRYDSLKLCVVLVRLNLIFCEGLMDVWGPNLVTESKMLDVWAIELLAQLFEVFPNLMFFWLNRG